MLGARLGPTMPIELLFETATCPKLCFGTAALRNGATGRGCACREREGSSCCMVEDCCGIVVWVGMLGKVT